MCGMVVSQNTKLTLPTLLSCRCGVSVGLTWVMFVVLKTKGLVTGGVA